MIAVLLVPWTWASSRIRVSRLLEMLSVLKTTGSSCSTSGTSHSFVRLKYSLREVKFLQGTKCFVAPSCAHMRA